jgi:hypothetical protein
MSTLDTAESAETLFDTVPETTVDTSTDPFSQSYQVFGDDVKLDEEEPEEIIEETKADEPEVPVKKQLQKPKSKEDVALKVDAGKAILKYLAERKGIAEDIDFDSIKSEDDIADLVEAMEEFDEAHAFERIKSTNKDIKKVVEYLQSGGDGSKISKLLTEQEEFHDLDVTTEDGAKTILKQYYKNVLGFDDEAINKRIKRFVDNGQLQEEAEDVKPLYDKNIEQRQQKLIEEAQKQKEKEKFVLKQRQQDFLKLLNENKVSQAVAKNYWGVAFGQRELEDGTKIGELDYKFQVMQRDPQQYLKLVEFMADPNLYDKRVLQTKANQQVTEQHNKRINFNSNKSPEVEEPVRENKPKFKF